MLRSSWCRQAVAAFITVFACMTLGVACKIVKNSKGGQVAARPGDDLFQGDFDAKVFVDGIWSGKILPALDSASSGIEDVFAALKNDEEKAAQKYGIKKEDVSLHSFVVRGSARVKAVNQESSAGTISLDLASPKGGSVSIQIGPVIKATMIRDALPFIVFGDFVNQVDYANVSREINNRIKSDVLSRVDMASIQGKRISFQGVFTFDPGESAVLITPFELTVDE